MAVSCFVLALFLLGQLFLDPVNGTCNPPSGMTCNGDGSYSDCPAGSFCSASNSFAAQACPSGFYCPVNSTQAQSCPTGKWTRSGGSTSTSDCQVCNAASGYYCSPTNGYHTQCPVGSYCPGGGVAHLNTYCSPGSWSFSPGAQVMASCLPCGFGAYCPGDGVREFCATGMWSDPGSTDNARTTDCVSSCPVDSYCNRGVEMTETSFSSLSATESGASRPMAAYSGKVLMVVNVVRDRGCAGLFQKSPYDRLQNLAGVAENKTAQTCWGQSQQFGDLVALQQTFDTHYGAKDIQILAFYNTQFGGPQDGIGGDGLTQFKTWATDTYGWSSSLFPVFDKVDVTGTEMHSIFDYLTNFGSCPGSGNVQQNYQKFLVAQNGKVKKCSFFDTPVWDLASQMYAYVEDGDKSVADKYKECLGQNDGTGANTDLDEAQLESCVTTFYNSRINTNYLSPPEKTRACTEYAQQIDPTFFTICKFSGTDYETWANDCAATHSGRNCTSVEAFCTSNACYTDDSGNVLGRCHDFADEASVSSCDQCTGGSMLECTAVSCTSGAHAYGNGICSYQGSCYDFVANPISSVTSCDVCTGPNMPDCTSVTCGSGYHSYDTASGTCVGSCFDFTSEPTIVSCDTCTGAASTACSAATCTVGYENYDSLLGECPEVTCDASTLPTHGDNVGTCSAALTQGTSCNPVCSSGHYLIGTTTCPAGNNGTLTATATCGTCWEFTGEASVTSCDICAGSAIANCTVAICADGGHTYSIANGTCS